MIQRNTANDPNPPAGIYNNLFDDLFRQTPRTVWDEYQRNGYTIHEALRMERSYA